MRRGLRCLTAALGQSLGNAQSVLGPGPLNDIAFYQMCAISGKSRAFAAVCELCVNFAALAVVFLHFYLFSKIFEYCAKT